MAHLIRSQQLKEKQDAAAAATKSRSPEGALTKALFAFIDEVPSTINTTPALLHVSDASAPGETAAARATALSSAVPAGPACTSADAMPVCCCLIVFSIVLTTCLSIQLPAMVPKQVWGSFASFIDDLPPSQHIDPFTAVERGSADTPEVEEVSLSVLSCLISLTFLCRSLRPRGWI
jgi:hypothetical protein